MSSTLTNDKVKISYATFEEAASVLDIRIGQIVDAERIPKSHNLKLSVSFGKTGELKTCVTNYGKTHEPNDLIGLHTTFLMNLIPSEIKGITSEVMILALPEANNVFGIGSQIL